MIVEERIYTVKVGKVGEYLKIYERTGLPLQKKYLGNLVGYYQTEIGELNHVVHLWAYDDLNDRGKRRTDLFADPDWMVYIRESAGLVERQENRILTPAPFFAKQLQAMLAAGRAA